MKVHVSGSMLNAWIVPSPNDLFLTEGNTMLPSFHCAVLVMPLKTLDNYYLAKFLYVATHKNHT